MRVGRRRRCGVGHRGTLGDSECGFGGGQNTPSASTVPNMASASTSKIEARRRAREATRRANEERAAREKANIESAATYIVAKAKLAEIDTWESERLAQVREHVRSEADRRRGIHRAEARAAVELIQSNGENLTVIAEMTGDAVGEIRGILRHPLKVKKRGTDDGSKALCADKSAAQPIPPRSATPL
jgi:hypothetical protein